MIAPLLFFLNKSPPDVWRQRNERLTNYAHNQSAMEVKLSLLTTQRQAITIVRKQLLRFLSF